MPPNQFYLVNASNGQTIMYGDLDLFMSALPDTHARIAQEERIAEAQAALTDTATELHERDVQIRAEHIRILAHVTDALTRRPEIARISQEGRIYGIVAERGVVAMHRVVHEHRVHCRHRGRGLRRI
jgi:hypothetical protein